MKPDNAKLAYKYKERKRKQNIKEYQEKFFRNLSKKKKNKHNK